MAGPKQAWPSTQDAGVTTYRSTAMLRAHTGHRTVAGRQTPNSSVNISTFHILEDHVIDRRRGPDLDSRERSSPAHNNADFTSQPNWARQMARLRLDYPLGAISCNAAAAIPT